jgi:hypothetical protein
MDSALPIKVTPLQDSMSILLTLQGAIQECYEIIKREKRDKESIVHAIADSQMMLFTHSFLEEWERLGSTCKDDKTRQFRKRVLPFINKIKSWTDLGLMRNTMIAHNLRDQKNHHQNILLYGYGRELNTTSSFYDRLLLNSCVDEVVKRLVGTYQVEYKDLTRQLKLVIKPKIKPGIKSHADASKILSELIRESSEIR